MKKNFLFALLFLCSVFCFSRSASAQAIGQYTVGGNLGFTSITSGGSGDKNSFHFNVEGSYRVDYKTSVVSTIGFTSYTNSSLLEVTGNGRYVFNPAEEYKFFGEVGLGSYTVKVDVLGLISLSQSYFGFNLGGGVIKNINDKVGIIAKVKYHNPLTGSDGALNWINTTVGVYFGL